MKKTIILAALFAASSASFAATTTPVTLWTTTYSGVNNKTLGSVDTLTTNSKAVNSVNSIFQSKLNVSSGTLYLNQGTSSQENVVSEGNTQGLNITSSETIIAGLAGAVGQGNETAINYNYTANVTGLAENERMSITAVKVEWVVFDNAGAYLGSSTDPSTDFGVNFKVEFSGDLAVNMNQRDATIAGQLNEDGTMPETLINGQVGPMVANLSDIYLENGTTEFDFKTSVTGVPNGTNNNLYVGLKSVEFIGEIVEVPEPATASLGILGLGALMLRRRRR